MLFPSSSSNTLVWRTKNRTLWAHEDTQKCAALHMFCFCMSLSAPRPVLSKASLLFLPFLSSFHLLLQEVLASRHLFRRLGLALGTALHTSFGRRGASRSCPSHGRARGSYITHSGVPARVRGSYLAALRMHLHSFTGSWEVGMGFYQCLGLSARSTFLETCLNRVNAPSCSCLKCGDVPAAAQEGQCGMH